MIKRLVVLDIDQTICDSRSADALLPRYGRTQEDYTHWHEAVEKTDFPIVRGARKAVRALVKNDKNFIVLVTSRSEKLRAATQKWLKKHFPELVGYPLSMRPLFDLSSSIDSKRGRVQEYTRDIRPKKIIIIDDDYTMTKLVTDFSLPVEFYQVQKNTWAGLNVYQMGGLK